MSRIEKKDDILIIEGRAIDTWGLEGDELYVHIEKYLGSNFAEIAREELETNNKGH